MGLRNILKAESLGLYFALKYRRDASTPRLENCPGTTHPPFHILDCLAKKVHLLYLQLVCHKTHTIAIRVLLISLITTRNTTGVAIVKPVSITW